MRAWIDLVRAPAALTVLGDTVAGSAAAGRPPLGRRLLLPAASVSFYWAGMALNDWADRDLDAIERPERPIPSGRIGPDAALAAALLLTGGGLGLAALGGGRRALPVAALLAGSIWTYDVGAKTTAAGPAVMALCRGLDVLLGAGGRTRAALPAAAVVAGHTLGLTLLAQGEVHGASRPAGSLALAGTLAAAGAIVVPNFHRAVPPGTVSSRTRWTSTALAVGYAVPVARAQIAALRTPSAPAARRATVTGIHGMLPLQAGLAARHGSLAAATVLAAALPLARLLARKVSPT